MCGIAGFALRNGEVESSRECLRRMCDAIMHRGPDSDGYFVAPGIALGMRRLSIIDVHGGRQPIQNEDGTITVVFNGEIYNHHALRRELEGRGHRFRTASDTEVLVHLYEDLGEDMFGRLNGMFAFAIWDENRRRLVLARDRVGMKPLSYRARPEGIEFFSELRSLFAAHRDSCVIDVNSVAKYLALGYVPDPMSIVAGVRKLPPGHFLVWDEARGARIQRYWSPPVVMEHGVNEMDLVDELREKLDRAVASHLESDVPLGALLSGGLDSSTVVALMARHASGRVRTFSVGFEEAEFDESAAAAAVAAELGTDHTAIVLRPNIDAALESIATIYDEPFSDSSAIPTFFVCQLARQGVTVALSGDGGDELFGGYSRYREILRREAAIPLWFRKVLWRIGTAMPHSWRGRNGIANWGRLPLGQYAATVAQPLRRDEGGVAADGIPGSKLPLSETFAEFDISTVEGDLAASMALIDVATYLPGDILTKVDRASMCVSLEARVPLLDAELVDFALKLPGNMRVTPGGGKALFRRAIRGLVPDGVLNRPKQGFGIPLSDWFRGPLSNRLHCLGDCSSRLAEYVDVNALRRLIAEHLGNRRNHSEALWRLMVLETWLMAFERGELTRPPLVPSLREQRVDSEAAFRSNRQRIPSVPRS